MIAIFSRLTGDPKYENAVEAISQKVHSLILEDPASPNNGLVPIFINANTGKFRYYTQASFVRIF
jgi:hypothetical protein